MKVFLKRKILSPKMLHAGKITCYLCYKKGNINYVVALLTGTRHKYRAILFRSVSKVSLFLLQTQHLNKLNQTRVSSRSHFLVIYKVIISRIWMTAKDALLLCLLLTIDYSKRYTYI